MMNESETTSLESDSSTFWVTVAISGSIFGFAAFFIKTLLTYIRIQASIGSLYTAAYYVFGIVVLAWLIKACGGGYASWYYNKKHGSVTVGRAAMFGFVTGVAITIVIIILGFIWHLIDPGFYQQKLQSLITITQGLDTFSADEKKMLVQYLTKNMSGPQNPGQQLFSGIFIYGIPNLITAMIGAKIIQKRKSRQTQKQSQRAG